MSTTYVRGVLFALMSALLGCGGDSRPDTGYGANEPVPAEKSCEELCERMVDCGGHLCEEDTGQSMQIEMFEMLRAPCMSDCEGSATMSKVSGETWSCLFGNSCRKVFGDDVCGMRSTYDCF